MEHHENRSKSGLALTLAAIALGFLTAPDAFAQDTDDNYGVSPPYLAAVGNTYGEWSTVWWQHMYSIPSAQNPLSDPKKCGVGQSGPVSFLGAPLSGSQQVVNESCTVPAGNAIFLPIINVECSTGEAPPFQCTDAESCRKCATTIGSHIVKSTLSASVDNVPVTGLLAFRAPSPSYTFTIPSDNVLGVHAGTYTSVSDGYWLMVKPLRPGTHYIHTFGAFDSTVGGGFTENVLYKITVTP